MAANFNPMTVPLFLPLTIVAITCLMLSVFLSNMVFKAALQNIIEPLDFAKVFPNYITSLIMRLALSEVAALAGFVLAMTTQQINMYLPFWFAALAFMLTAFPVEDKILENAKHLKTQSLK